MDAWATSEPAAQTAETQRPGARQRPSTLAQSLLCRARAVVSGNGSSLGLSILAKVKPPTGEPYAGDPPVRFGGRGSRTLSLPLSFSSVVVPPRRHERRPWNC